MNKTQQKAQEEQIALVEMYKAGFRDAAGRWGKKTQERALECFKMRFMTKSAKKSIKKQTKLTKKEFKKHGSNIRQRTKTRTK